MHDRLKLGERYGVPVMTDHIGVRLGIDVGEVRVGVAVSDPNGILASPLVTLARDRRHGRDIAGIAALVEERQVIEVIVGMPTSLSGAKGRAARNVTSYVDRLAKRIAPVPVRTCDERMTTVIASRTLSEQGVRAHRQRAVIDQAAAVLILQSWLDGRRDEYRQP